MTSRQFDRATLASAQRRSMHQTDVPKANLTRAAHHDPRIYSGPGASGLARPRTLAAALAQASGGRLSRAGSSLLHLQRQYGNSYVQQVAEHARQLQSPNSGPVTQTKLVLGTAGDRYEREADRVAQRVVNKIVGRRPAEQHRGPAGDSDGALTRTPDIQRLGSAGGPAVETDVQQAIQRAEGRGRRLPDDVRSSMEQRFGQDLSGVRVHTDVQADQLSHRLQARAFTTGQDIFFRQGTYEPRRDAGRRLLAHELTHVVQQNGMTQRIQRNGDGETDPFAHRRRQFKPGIDSEEAHELRMAKYLAGVKARRRAAIANARSRTPHPISSVAPISPLPELEAEEVLPAEEQGADMEIDELTELMGNLSLSFTDNSGDHTVYPDMELGDLIVNHNPVPLKTIITTKMWEKIALSKKTLAKLTAQQQAATSALQSFGKKRTQQAGDTLRQVMRKVAKTLKAIGTIPLPKTDLSKSTHYGSSSRTTEGTHVKAKPLSLRSDTSGYGPTADGRLMTAIRKLAGPEHKSYKQMHLLNDNTFGPGQLWNLTPGPAQSNSDMESDVEDALKRAVLDKGLVMTFEAVVDYRNDPVTASDQEIDNNPDRYRFDRIRFKATQQFADAASKQYTSGGNVDPDIQKIDGSTVRWRYGSLTPLVPKPKILSTLDVDELTAIGIGKLAAQRIVAYNTKYSPYELEGKNKQKQLSDRIKAKYGGRTIITEKWKATDVLWS